MRVIGATILVLVLAVAASCSDDGDRPPGADLDLDVSSTTSTVPTGWATYSEHGMTLRYPPEWNRADEVLTPHLGDTTRDWERASLGTGLLPPNDETAECAQFPVTAIEALGPADVLVSIQEPTNDRDLPAKPDRLPRATTQGQSQAEECVRNGPAIRSGGAGISIDGRDFYLYVWMGLDVAEDDQALAWEVLDSLTVDPSWSEQ